MAHQTTMNDTKIPPVSGILSGIGDLGTNVATLATLQAKLAAADLRETVNRALPALVGVAFLIPLAVASSTVGMIGLAYLISVSYQLSLSKAFLGLSLVGLLVSIVLAVAIVTRLRISFVSFRRSREELERNAAWIGSVLSNTGR